jgi:hypothetical protein
VTPEETDDESHGQSPREVTPEETDESHGQNPHEVNTEEMDEDEVNPEDHHPSQSRVKRKRTPSRGRKSKKRRVQADKVCIDTANSIIVTLNNG